MPGTLSVTQAVLTATAVDTFRLYGAINPTFRIRYTGFVNGDGIGNITQPSAFSAANITSHAGTYPITLSGGSALNYQFVLSGGTLTVRAAPLIVKANDLAIFKGDPLPTSNFSSTYSGFLNGDQTTITGGPSYAVSPNYIGNAGTYTITPSNLRLVNQADYTISYQTGTLYVDPKGSGTKNIKPVLDCVEPLANNDPSGFKYIAHYHYENPNSTPVLIPLGTENFLTSAGPYSGTLPIVFQPGTGKVNIYFNGLKMTWTVISFNGNQKTSAASDASSTRRNVPVVVASGQIPVIRVLLLATTPTDVDLLLGKPNAYPNPVTNKVIVNVGTWTLSAKDIRVFDVTGRLQQVKSLRSLSAHAVELDLSALRKGNYMIIVSTNDGLKTFKIVKL
jgi:hypothetical protein